MAACVAASAGLAVATLLVLAAWIAAPHVGDGLTSVMRAAAVLWLIGHHVGFTSRGGVRIGMLPLGLALLPGALLWRAGRWVVRAGGVSRLRHVGYAALALAAPYGLLTMTLALASQSPQAAPAVLQAGVCGFLLALTAGGLGGARALAPWTRLTDLLPDRARSVIVGAGTALAALVIAGAVLAAVALGTHLTEFATLSRGLAPDAVGGALLLLAQLAYVPNALIWSVSFIVGPGFAIGTGTVVAPTGTVLGQLPAFPMLAALPPGVHSGTAAWLAGLVLAFPYLAGCAWRPADDPGSAHALARDGAAVGAGLRRGDRMPARSGGRLFRRPSRQRAARGRRPVGLAGGGGCRAGGGRRRRRDRRRRQLAHATRRTARTGRTGRTGPAVLAGPA